MILRHNATCCVPGVVCSDYQDRDFEHGTQHITVSSEFYAFHSPSKQAKSGSLNGLSRMVLVLSVRLLSMRMTYDY